jgi:hypothetical protein
VAHLRWAYFGCGKHNTLALRKLRWHPKNGCLAARNELEIGHAKHASAADIQEGRFLNLPLHLGAAGSMGLVFILL